MDYLSLFSGIGGFEYGIQQSNIPMNCIGFSEIDKYAKSIYQKHFPNHIDWGDATEIRAEELPDFDLLVGGFPCQAFSIAGKRRGFDDTRGTLFFEIARILKDKRPKYFLLENVNGLLSHDKGKTFKTILKILSDLGYYVKWEVLNSKEFVPQNRERIFIKGYFRGECGGEVLSFRRSDEKTYDKSLNSKNIKLIKYGNQGSRVYDSEGVSTQKHATHTDSSYSPCLNSAGKNNISMLKLHESTKKGYAIAEEGDGVELSRIACTTRRGVVHKNETGTLNTMKGSWGTVTSDCRIRRLTPLECERLQGFPDDWTRYGADGEEISDTQRYKCCGNAVTTNVITFIINEMFGDLNES